jgi:Flp pilus assembly protein TadB
MDPAIWASLIALASGGVGGTFQWLRARKRQQVTDKENVAIRAEASQNHSAVIDEARYDNLQQDFQEERVARRRETSELRADVQRLSMMISVLGQDIRVRDDYIMKLRQHIANGQSPPPPEWPVSLTKSIT